jgi:Zn-finger nucleic acid-binding protein
MRPLSEEGEVMKCPECGAKITTKHFDAEYGWYECPKCEGAFLPNEIEEARNAEPSRKPKRNSRGKAYGGGRKERKNARGTDEEIQKTLRGTGRKVLAKGKKRRTEIAEDEEVIKEFEKEILKPTVKQQGPKHHRDEVETRQVINIWGDEFQEIYHELGMELDEGNAQDKALILWREIHINHGAVAREAEVPHAVCKEHS